MWIWGIVLVFSLVLQIVTGIVLVMHYTPDTTLAFASVEHIMRNVNGGWAFRYIHMNGASLFFVAVYAHIFRNLYYGSYKYPREVTWIIGMLIYLLMMATAFMGYVLPWGQMSFWGATVITGLFGAVPFIGDTHPDLAPGRAGGRQRDADAVLLAALPAALRDPRPRHRACLGLPPHGQQQPDRRRGAARVKEVAQRDTVPFWPYFVMKDLYALVFILVIFAAIVGFMPNYLGHPDNYIEADALATPAHIVPEWYFLPFYAILRAITFDILFIRADFGGVLAMFGAILVMALAPWLDTSRVRSGRYRPTFKIFFWLLVLSFFVLMWGGAMPAEQPYVAIIQVATLYWFAYFLVVLPVLGLVEKPLPEPATIEEDFLSKNPDSNKVRDEACRVRGDVMTIRRTILSAAVALGLAAGLAAPAQAAGEAGSVTDFRFSFEGPFGRFDQAQLQRGLQVYTEVCAACHGLQYVPFRTLSDPGGPGLSDEQMRAYAAQFEVEDRITGEWRTAEPTDHFPASQLEGAPDLSLMAKARAGFHGPYGTGLNQLFRGMGGPEYIASFLLKYTGVEEEQAGVILYENAAYDGYVSMPPVLFGDDVVYADGTEATMEQVALDVSAFLMWTAEPKMMARKEAGLTAVLFLFLLTALLFFTNKKLWADVKGKGKKAL
jgi:ubiquinol-cytochrome c reductase cytochrome b/c1 subunit